MTNQPVHSPQFFLTAPSPCPYLDGQFERKVFTHLVGEKAAELNDLLTQGGFRRSQNIDYRPACESCRACVSVRILADAFRPNKSMRRNTVRNGDIVAREFPAEPSSEQYALFRDYLDARHQKGGMSDMTVLDYAMMVEDTYVPTKIIEYRIPGEADPDGSLSDQGRLVAVALSDIMSDGLSMVYSFFDPDYESRSLGTFMILDHIQRAQDRGLPHVYLGYWVEGSRKMEYKTRFQPQEHLCPNGWERYED